MNQTLTTQQSQYLQEIIHQYRVDHWLDVTDTGLRTLQRTESKIRWRTFALSLLLLMLALLQMGNIEWGRKIIMFILPLFVLGILVQWNWRVDFNLLEGKVKAGMFGINFYSRDLSQFTKFASNGGAIVNGVDVGGSLLMKFKDTGNLRIAILRNSDDFHNIQTVLLKAMVTLAAIKPRPPQ